MTLQEIKNTGKTMLLPAEVAPILGCDAHSIRVQARQYPELLGFPVIVAGSGVRVPKQAFLRFMRGSG